MSFLIFAIWVAGFFAKTGYYANTDVPCTAVNFLRVLLWPLDLFSRVGVRLLPSGDVGEPR